MQPVTPDDVLESLRRLVAFPTVSRTPNLPLLEWLGEQLAARGARVTIHPGTESGCANLTASIGPAVAGGLVLSGHTDVVPPGDGWTSDPWVACVEGHRVRGRGTADMKGFFAGILAALDRIDPSTLVRPVHVLASYDEEVGCRGVRDVLPQLAALMPSPRCVVVGEPTMMRPRLASPGKLALRITTSAIEGHSSRARELPSAITAAARIVLAIDEAMHLSDDRAVLNVGTIHGGSQLNVIANRCAFDAEIRHQVGCDVEAVLAPLWEGIDAVTRQLDVVGGAVDVVELAAYPPSATPHDDPALADLERIVGAASREPVTFGTEGGLLSAALGAPVVICGPGDIAHAHGRDESVEIAQLVRCAEVVSALVRADCTA